MANGNAKAAVASEMVSTRRQKGKKLKEEVEVYTESDGVKQLEKQTMVSKPGKSKFDYEQYVQSGDTLQTTKGGKQSIYVGPKAAKRFERKASR